MPPPQKDDDLSKGDIIGIVVGTVVGTGLLLALFIAIRQRRREKRLRLEFEKAATFAEAAASIYRAKSFGVENEEEEENPPRYYSSANPRSSNQASFSVPPCSAVSELNPYNFRMRPELPTNTSSSRVDVKEKGVASAGPHELEGASASASVTVPSCARVANHVLGENESEAGSPVVEVKEVKI
ncbi:uncharacterized protein MYCFIDRAFT_193604 [Pseudocercospora fijiensis CIRAD86]|uniref:Uncharacterized protein n=1 Tax=Pseudocercospora fijiensis (strain CIRAD86) TaxID=383855 RepID=N1QA59_PSEFD|nr:uncharacterized protein MYCFIDRAFT_193604 [Pseudocercospora fijiensis CIRAD86]EME89764.1 hypothetical protein MYCFIDRAFT_193604 [Pseudocercospora fijiensis CIRAD86]